MNSYAGCIRIKNDQTPDLAWLARLKTEFPDKFLEAAEYANDTLAFTARQFTPSFHFTYGSELYFNGYITNRIAAATLIRQPVEVFEHDGALVHALILWKGIDALHFLEGDFVLFYYNEAIEKAYLFLNTVCTYSLICCACSDVFLFASDIRFLLAHPSAHELAAELLSPAGIYEIDFHAATPIMPLPLQPPSQGPSL